MCGARHCGVSGPVTAPLSGHTRNCPVWVPHAQPACPYISVHLQKQTDVAQLQQFLWINAKPPAFPAVLKHNLPQSCGSVLTAPVPPRHRTWKPVLRFHNCFREHSDAVRTRSKYISNIRASLLYSPRCFWTQIKTKGTGLQHTICESLRCLPAELCWAAGAGQHIQRARQVPHQTKPGRTVSPTLQSVVNSAAYNIF